MSCNILSPSQNSFRRKILPYIVKTALSANFAIGERITFTEKTFKPHGGYDISTGDELFIWFSEENTPKGQGLAGIGEVNEVKSQNNKRVEITLTPNDIVPHTPMTKSFLKRYDSRNLPIDSNDGEPITGITKKLYVHSHNKVAYLTDEEADFLRRHFQ